MKLKALGSLCSRVKQIVLYDEARELWIGDGVAAYRMPDALRDVSESAITAIFDIPSEKAADFLIRRIGMPESLCTGDTDTSGDQELDFDLSMRIVWAGTDYLPLRTKLGRTYLIRTKYIKPIEDAEQIRFSLRHQNAGDGWPYIAAKDGMFLTALILPERIGDNERIVGIEGWVNSLATGLSNARKFEAAADETV